MYFEQMDLEKKFSKDQACKELHDFFVSQENEQFSLAVKVIAEFMESSNQSIWNYWQDNGISSSSVVAKFLTVIAVGGRNSMQAILAQLTHICGKGTEFSDALVVCAQLISILEASGMVYVSEPSMRKGIMFVELNVKLHEYFHKRIGNCAYLPPMLMPVKPSSNRNAGWISIRKSIFLNSNHHEGNAPLHWLDTLNSIAFSIDLNMLKYDEAVDIDIQRDRKKLRGFKDRRALTIRTIKEVLAYGNQFYFIHRFCARYRAYASGYTLSPQGNDYRKALLNLAKQETLTDEYHF